MASVQRCSESSHEA